MSIANDEAPRGFVPMREYLRLKERCEELEERLACQREDERDKADDTLVMLVRSRLGISSQQARVVITLATSRRPLVTAELVRDRASMPSRNQVNVVFHKLRQRLTARGCPRFADGFPGHGLGGWRLTDEGRRWLQERIPELFTPTEGAQR